jgi:transcriptional regulator with XRE-family HTH domain
MGHPVYPFRAVLRELRHDAGLTILAAAEATGYGKYERWESGQTKVGGQYLRSIAEAFDVTDDLHLLLYAWVLDQLTPDAASPARRLDLDELCRHVRQAPDTVIDLHEHKALIREPGRHVDLALLCLAARYADRGVVILPAAERRDLPPREPTGSILDHLYGDVVQDGVAAMGRALLTRGIDEKPDAIDVSNISPAMANPNTYLALADDLDTIEPTADQPVVTFAAGTATDARRFAELLTSLRHQNRRLLEAAGKPATDEDVERLTEKVVAGKTGSVLWLLLRAAARRRFPKADPALTAELRAMRDRLRDGWQHAIEQQAVTELRRADTAQVFEALDALRSRRTA